MHIFVGGDIHMNTAPLVTLPGIADAETVVLNGDLTNFGGEQEAAAVLAAVRALNPKVLAHPGNLDREGVARLLDREGINLHAHATTVGSGRERLIVIGLGGSNLTPFRTPTEYSEEELEQFARSAFAKADRLSEKYGRLPRLFVSHTPPAECRIDRLSNGGHAGSIAVRRIIAEFHPALTICGHIHEAAGEDRIDGVPVINPGTISGGHGVRIDFDGTTLKTETV